MAPNAMLEAYYYFLRYRLDFVLLALVVAGSCLWIWRNMRSRGPQFRIPLRAFVIAGGIVLAGGVLAEWAAENQMASLAKTFSGFGPTYASEMTQRGHEFITLDTPADDPRYLELIELEKRWLRVNPIIADVYTFRKDKDGKLRLIVDSETDYDHNGKFEGDREQRTPIGEVYEEATPGFFRALEGEIVFDTEFMSDRWGIWVSSFCPLYSKDGHVEAAVGIDYPAKSWLNEIGSVRAVCLGIALVLDIILLTSSTFISFLSTEIEERKQAQVRLEQARESALESSAAKSEFLAVTSHEVRTPLAAIMGFASILADTKLDATQRRYLDTMNHAGERLLDLLNSILDFTNIESGRLELERVPWSPAIMIHEVMESLSALAIQRTLTLNFDNFLPSNLTLSGDANRIRQILMNLTNNALKYTVTGGVTVRATWTPDQANPDSGKMAIGVIDTGPGIRPEKIPDLFKAFAQADASTTRTQSGTGLGLAISKRLADMMNGALTVTSAPGKGAEFTLSLTCKVTAQTAPVSTSKRPSVAPVPVYSARALVVDDQRLNRELLKVMLRRCGIEADLAASGPEAIDLAARNPYAIIFTDLEMPDMDGFTTAIRIRAAESPGKRVPIVAISALTSKGTRERCIAAGMDDYITKPVYLPALHSSLAALLPQTAPLPVKPAAPRPVAV